MKFWVSAALSLSLLLVGAAVSDDASETDLQNTKQAEAVSKYFYDAIQRLQESADRLASLGVNLGDIEADNLPFASENFTECEELATATAGSDDQAAIYRIACFKRYRANLAVDSYDPLPR